MSKDMLGGNTAEEVRTRVAQALREPPAPKRVVAVPPEPLLDEVGTPTEVAAAARFVACEKIVIDRYGELPISGLGSNFKTHFLGVVEENVPAATLKQRKLRRRSVDGPILAELGDIDPKNVVHARVFLAQMYAFLKTADRSGWHIFYAADMTGVSWAVSANWYDDGWSFEASSVENPDRWSAGRVVVSR